MRGIQGLKDCALVFITHKMKGKGKKNELCFDTPMIIIFFLGLSGALYLLKDSFNDNKSCDCDK